MFKWLKKMLEKLAAENSKEMGNKRLDCCDLNQQDNNSGQKKG